LIFKKAGEPQRLSDLLRPHGKPGQEPA
jgi:hypothetical protein